MNYYKDRKQAGQMLANELAGFKGQSCAVVALSEGAVVVGAEIAKQIHSTLFILTTQHADDQAEGIGTALGSGGIFSYNTGTSLGELEEDAEAWRTFTNQRSINEFQKLNHVAGKDGTIPKQLLKRHVVILVSDGLHSALSLEIAAHFMHTLDLRKLVIATPIASSQAVDKMHISVDQIFCLRSVENYISTNHYYENNDIPDDKTVVETLQNIVLNWPNP